MPRLVNARLLIGQPVASASCVAHTALLGWAVAETAMVPASGPAAWRYGLGVSALSLGGLCLVFAVRHRLPAWSVRLFLALYALLLFLPGLDMAAAAVHRRAAATAAAADWRYRNRAESSRMYEALRHLAVPSGTPLEHVGPFAPNRRGRLLRSTVTTDAWGYRREIGPPQRCPEPPAAQPCQEKRVLCVGGSTTWGMTQEAGDLPYPDVLETVLAAQSSRYAVHVINAGIVAAKVVDARVMVERQATFGAPVDVVVLYAPGLNLIPPGIKGRALPRVSLAATVLDRAYIRWRGARAVERYDGALLAEALYPFVATVREHNAVPILVTTALPFTTESAPEVLAYWDTLVAWHSSARTLARFIEIQNATVRRVVENEGAILVDAARELSGRAELFIDEDHFTQRGRDELAAAIAPAVLAALQQDVARTD